MLKLVKGCDADHLIDRCSSLCIGSLQDFRLIEKADLRDEREARFDLVLHIEEPTTFSATWMSTILNGTINFGSRIIPPRSLDYTCVTDEFEVIKSDPNFVTAVGTIGFKYNLYNCLVFCVSIDGGSVSDYRASWSFDIQKANEFSMLMAHGISQALTVNHIDLNRSGSLPISRGSDIFVYQIHGPIYYGGKDLIIRGEADLPIDNFFNHILQCRFRKDDGLSKENEYRFSFDIFVDGRQTFTNRNPIFISSLPFRENINLICTEDR